MATTTTTKKTTTTTKAQEENAELKAKLVEQESQIAKLTEQLAILTASLTNAPQQTKQAKKNDKHITFINLIPGTLVLRGSGNKIWTIEDQFAKRQFTETEASTIVANMANLVNNGGLYITDSDFIEEHNLTDIFDHILSDRVLKNILEQDSHRVVELYMEASPLQQETIVTMIEHKCENGEKVDANILRDIGKLCKKDLMSLVEG